MKLQDKTSPNPYKHNITAIPAPKLHTKSNVKKAAVWRGVWDIQVVNSYTVVEPCIHTVYSTYFWIFGSDDGNKMKQPAVWNSEVM